MVNYFKDIYEIKDLYFYGFEGHNDQFRYVSRKCIIDIPPSIRYGVYSASVIIQRYIYDNKIVIPETTDCQPVQQLSEIHREEMGKQGANEYLSEFEQLKNAIQINARAKAIQRDNPEMFPLAVMKRIGDLAYSERLYGNRKNDAVELFRAYFAGEFE